MCCGKFGLVCGVLPCLINNIWSQVGRLKCYLSRLIWIVQLTIWRSNFFMRPRVFPSLWINFYLKNWFRRLRSWFVIIRAFTQFKYGPFKPSRYRLYRIVHLILYCIPVHMMMRIMFVSRFLLPLRQALTMNRGRNSEIETFRSWDWAFWWNYFKIQPVEILREKFLSKFHHSFGFEKMMLDD